MNDLWQPLLLSLRIAGAATFLAGILMLPLALWMARRNFVGKSAVDALLIVPLVMPPTVVGFILIMLFGNRGWLGKLSIRLFGATILFHFAGAVIAAATVAAPLLYQPAKAAFGNIDRDLVDAARLEGANPWKVFWYITLPMARRGLLSGTILCFARALGEFGATLMVFGWQADRVTLPISIYSDYYDGVPYHASAAVAALAVICVVLMLICNRIVRGDG
jgi:molybdate transport system permease protein